MSSTLAPEITSERNPISEKDVLESLESLNLKPRNEDVPDLTNLLTGIWEVWDKVNQMDDYVPEVDETRFPRKDVHRPEGEDNAGNAWAWKCDVRDQSASAEGKRLLAGKTLSLKDNIALKGVPCLLGTDIFQDWTPNMDATVVTRILEAGGIIRGKAVCENLSAWAVSCSAATGPISNAWADSFSAGGSSSGSGYLIAKGECWGGMGGDQGGSIRIPSSANGLVGMKPSFGLVPYTGIASLEPTLDHTGPMTRTVLDNALLLQAVAGADEIDDRQQAGCPFPDLVPDYPALAQQGVRGLKIGIIKESLDRPLHDPRVSELVVKAAKLLETLGCVVEEVSVPMHADAPDIWAVPGRLSVYKSLVGEGCGRQGHCMNDMTEKMLPIDQEKYDKMWCAYKNWMVNGRWGWDHLEKPGLLLGKATNLTRKLRDEYYKVLEQYDVLITPTMPFLPPKLPAEGASIKDLMKNSAGASLNTSAFNITGLPALSLPVGFLPSLVEPHPKLPVGMQIVSKLYHEVTIYRVAYAWEQAADWKEFS
ncbi:amidase signature enzyme [Apiospora saccharicola]|uniref:Amidase signature enzyme n=1 Tax=Apiospora saccharicola TaxID=335842 RepID=A0ABR1UGS7_9PEZI